MQRYPSVPHGALQMVSSPFRNVLGMQRRAEWLDAPDVMDPRDKDAIAATLTRALA